MIVELSKKYTIRVSYQLTLYTDLFNGLYSCSLQHDDGDDDREQKLFCRSYNIFIHFSMEECFG